MVPFPVDSQLKLQMLQRGRFVLGNASVAVSVSSIPALASCWLACAEAPHLFLKSFLSGLVQALLWSCHDEGDVCGHTGRNREFAVKICSQTSA